MAETADGRVYKRKRLTDPTDENTYLDIPVLTEAKFKSMQQQAQEFFVYFDNSQNSSRKVHTQRVTNNQDSSQFIDVERIDEWNIKIMQEQAQESTFVMTNNDPPPIQPDGSNNPSHEKTHVVRYYKDNDSNSDTWCDVELIDELKIKCMAEQAQEYTWYMKNPELGSSVNDSDVSYPVTIGECDSGLELDDSTSPYRLDPFRNIVNIKWGQEQSPSCGDTLYVFDPASYNENNFWLVMQATFGGEAPLGLNVNWYGYNYEIHKTFTNNSGGMIVWVYHKIPNVDYPYSPVPGDYENQIQADRNSLDLAWNNFLIGKGMDPGTSDSIKSVMDSAIADILDQTSQGNFGTEEEGLNYNYNANCCFDGNYSGFGPSTGISYDEFMDLWTVIDVQGHFVRWGSEAEAMASLLEVPPSLEGQGQNFYWYIGPSAYGVGYALMTKRSDCLGGSKVPSPS